MKFLSIIPLLFVCVMLKSQDIRGQLNTLDGESAAYASAVLYQAADTTLVKGAIADLDGVYVHENISDGRYFIRASMVGMADVDSDPFDYRGEPIDIPPLVFRASGNELDEVVVKVRRPLIEADAEKTVMNVEGNITATGSNALEVLRKAPGVVVDQNDNILLKGKSGVQIFIDGRPSPMSGDDLAAFLKSLDGNQISKIELISNPSAKYDAEGNAGIINIKLMKNQNYGTNGSLQVGFIQGITPKGSIGLNINNRVNKWNTYGSMNVGAGEWHNDMHLVRDQFGRTFDQQSNMIRDHQNYSLKVGSDFYMDSRNTFGVVYDGFINDGMWTNDARTMIRNSATSRVDSLLIASNTINSKTQNHNANINWSYEDTLGHVITADVDYGLFRKKSESYQPNTYTLADGSTALSERVFGNNAPTDIDIVAAKVDYEQKLGPGTFGAGSKFTLVNTKNTFDFFDYVDDHAQLDPDRSNKFYYDEQVFAAYLNYKWNIGKFGFQTGLRAERTDWKGDLRNSYGDPEQEVIRDTLNFFPSAAVTYSPSDDHALNVTYSRRIDRPNYQDLNPFEEQLDELSFRKGNPFLNPQYSNNVELSYTYKSAATLSLGYNATKDVFTEVIETLGEDASFMTQRNIADRKGFNMNISSPLPISKWLNGYFNFNLSNTAFDADFGDGYVIKESITAYSAYSEFNVILPHDFSLQVSGWYNNGGLWGVFRNKDQGAMDFGMQKKFGDWGTLRLVLGDILNTAGWSSINDFTPDLYMTADGNWESRLIKLNFNYKFGNNKVKQARRRSTGIEEAADRIKSGN